MINTKQISSGLVTLAVCKAGFIEPCPVAVKGNSIEVEVLRTVNM